MTKTIRRLLVANRAEIARRIFRTAHEMGISTVAVYSEGDAEAPFVQEADQAIALGGRSSAESYLDTDKVLEAARRTRADAIHPGYGFLAENAAFAKAVVDAGLIWVGPSPEAITAMGDKLSAKRLMQESEVPTLPAVEVTGDQDLGAAAAEIGYPVLIKASAGGGGKGMRIVHESGELAEAVESARREAGSSFGDDTVFLERWLEASRHVEIQLLGDEHGNVVHCFERECSIQRRHQKIIEEAPSAVVSPELREKMGDAAVRAGKAIGYSSAGTVEFLLDDSEGKQDFWFLEVNTRLQVEHPVTEEITGLDLVREQLLVAQGEPLSFDQSDLTITGHAIEARLYAEDPDNDFFPSIGTVEAWAPSTSVDARFDSGIESGSEVGIEFDPMLAKVIAYSPTRREAASKLARALETTRVQGLVTNRDFLVEVLRAPEFLAAETRTDFIDKVEPARRREPSAEEIREGATAAALAAQADRRSQARLTPNVPSGWRNTLMPPEIVRFRHRDDEASVHYRVRRDGAFDVETHLGDEAATAVATVLARSSTDVTIELDGRRLHVSTSRAGDRWMLHGPDGDLELVQQPRFPAPETEGVAGGLVAPMPGKVLSTHVEVGDEVEPGDLLLVLEAMKMEHRVRATDGGEVRELRVSEGDQVANGELLVVIATSDDGRS